MRNLQLHPAPLSTKAERLSYRDHENIGLGLAMFHTTAIVAQLESGSNSSFQGRQGSLKGAILLGRPGALCTSPWWPGLRLPIYTGHTIKFPLMPSNSFTDGTGRIINLTKPMELVRGNNQDSIIRLLVSGGCYFSAVAGGTYFTDKFYIWEPSGILNTEKI